MPTFIALVRGINVGGHRLVSMASLRGLLSELDFGNPRSLLQAGNLVFEAKGPAATLEARLESAAASRLSLHTDFIVRDLPALQRVVSRNPFPEMAAGDPAHLIVMFLKETPPAGAVAALQAAVVGRETIAAAGAHLYVTYPDGIGRSRLNGTVIEKALRTRGTARNWNTVLKLAALASRP